MTSMSVRFTSLTTCVVLALLLAVVPARAQPSSSPPSPDSQDRAAQDPGDVTKSQTNEKKRPKKDDTSKHPASFKIGEDVTIRLTARIESDVRMATPDIGFDQTELEWQDRRIGIEGTVYKRFTFELSRELSDDFSPPPAGSSETAWKDAYVKTRFTKALIVGGGRFKEPMGREALTSETNLDFVYRSLVARVLSPGRDAGVMAEGRVADKLIEYQGGYFTRDGENSRTSETQGGEDAIVGRLVVSPFVHATSGSVLAPLQVGVSLSNSRLDDRLGLRGRTSLGDTIFFDRVYVNGRRQRTGLEAEWAHGPGSISTEYMTVVDERKGMGFSGEDLANVHATGWYVAGTWALTGEHKHGRLEPRHDLLRGGFGAVELAGRVERLRFDAIDYPGAVFGFPTPSKLVANADRVVTLGVNWYLNQFVKLQANVIKEAIADPNRGPSAAANGRFTSTVFRFQFRL
jgi:phosphate-selective porin OprO and OprP